MARALLTAATLTAAHGQTAATSQDPAALLRAVKANPNSATLTGELVVALANNGHLEDAYRLAQTFYQNHPHDLGAQRLYLRVLVATHQATAVPLARRLLAAYPHDSEFLYLNGVLELKAEQLTQSRDHLREAIALTPEYAESRYNLGVVLARLQDASGAKEQLQKAVALGASEPEAHLELSRAMRTLGETQDADEQLKLYQQAMKLGVDRQMAAGKTTEATQALGAGDAQKAVGLYREALEASPQDASLQLQLAAALDETGDTAAERKALERAVQIDPGMAPAQYQLGYLLFRSGEYEVAAQHFQVAVKDDPKFTQAWLSLAAALASQSKFAEAQDAVGQAIRLEPHNVQAVEMKKQLTVAEGAH